MLDLIAKLLPLWILGALASSAYLVWAIYFRPAAPAGPAAARGATGARRISPVPGVGDPAPGISSRPDTGVVEHLRRGSAPTVRLSSDDTGTERIRKASESAEDPAERNLQRATRMAELGFHTGVQATEAPAAPAAPAPSAAAFAPTPVPAAPAPAADAPARAATEPVTEPTAATAIPAAAQPRTQTAELDDILKRIDQVLADTDAPPAEQTMPAAEPKAAATLPVAQQPPTERMPETPRQQTDGQQRLF